MNPGHVQIPEEPTQSTASVPSAPARYHSLDALRAVALLLGILLHAGLSYLPGKGIGWAIHDRSTHWLFGVAILVVHSFRLEIFFLLAGFFARLMFVRRGLRGFVFNRLVRVLVPFVAGWFLVIPGLAFAWKWGASGGDPSAIPDALKHAVPPLILPFQSLAHFTFFKYFPLTHLWFLYYLLLLYTLFLAGRALVVRLTGHEGAWCRGADRLVGWLVETRMTPVLLATVTGFMLLGMKTWSVDTPDWTFRPQIPALLLYGFVFSLGWMLHRRTELLETIRRRWWIHLICAGLSVLPALALVGYEGQASHPHFHEIRWLYLFVYALMMWFWIFAFLGLFLRFRDQESRFWRYVSDSSYWLYIVHLPVVVILQVAVARLPVSCWIKFSLVCGLAIPFSLLTYHYLVRSTVVGRVLNGRRYPFRWFPSAGLLSQVPAQEGIEPGR